MGISTFELGLIVSILPLTTIIAKIPLGILAERAGKWPVILLALSGQGLCLLFYSLVTRSWWFYPIRIFHALILAAFLPTVLALVSDLAPKGKVGDRMGRFLTSFGIAYMVGPFLSSFLLKYVDYRLLLRIAATIPLISVIPFFLARYKGLLISSEEQDRCEAQKVSSLSSIRSFAFSRNILVLCYLRIIFSFTNAFLLTLFAVYASESLLLTSSLIAILFGIRGATNTMFRFPVGVLTDRIGYKLPLGLAFLLLTFINFTFSESRNVYILSLAMAIYGLGHAMRAVSEWSLLGISTPSEVSSVATAYLSTMFNIGEAFGAVTAGALSLILPIPYIFKIASLILFSGIFIAFLIKQDVRKH